MPIVLGTFTSSSTKFIMRGRYESASMIGCLERTRMFINMMSVVSSFIRISHICAYFAATV